MRPVPIVNSVISVVHVAVNYAPVFCYECDYELCTFFKGGSEGYAETVSFLFLAVFSSELHTCCSVAIDSFYSSSVL